MVKEQHALLILIGHWILIGFLRGYSFYSPVLIGGGRGFHIGNTIPQSCRIL